MAIVGGTTIDKCAENFVSAFATEALVSFDDATTSIDLKNSAAANLHGAATCKIIEGLEVTH